MIRKWKNEIIEIKDSWRKFNDLKEMVKCYYIDDCMNDKK